MYRNINIINETLCTFPGTVKGVLCLGLTGEITFFQKKERSVVWNGNVAQSCDINGGDIANTPGVADDFLGICSSVPRKSHDVCIFDSAFNQEKVYQRM